MDAEAYLRLRFEFRQIDSGGDRKIHGHRRPVQRGDGFVNEIDDARIGFDFIDDALRPNLGRRRFGQPLQAGANATLGIQQELGGRDHPLAFLQAGTDFHPVAGLHTDFDRPRLEPPSAEIDDRPLLRAGADQRLARNVKYLGARCRVDDHIGEHVELEPFAGIGKTQPGTDGAGLGVHVGVDVLHRTFPRLAGRVRQPHLGLLTHRQPAGLLFEHLDLDPDGGRIGQRH